MSDKYKMKDILETMIDNNEPHWSADTMDMVKAELDRLYTRDFKADEIKTINGILLGKMDTLKINLNYYKKQAAKADEYEAKAKAFDRIVEQRKETGVITLGHYAFEIIREYESGESDD